MDDTWRFEAEQSTIEEEDAKADQEFYETIEAPKFVDFTRPNHFCPDDRYWFCSRVGCNENHEAGLDSETIYKDFVLRVMAARSPNVRFQRALKKSTSDSKKCPMSAPPKSSKSRIPRLAVVSLVSRKLLDDGGKDVVKPAPVNPAPKSKARVKHVPAKYMTSPRKKKGSSPKLDTFKSVRNSNKSCITIQKSKFVAKALVFSSPKKVVKPKASDLATPVAKLCEEVNKLTITTEKTRIIQKASVRKLPSSACNTKTRKECPSAAKNLEQGAKSTRLIKGKAIKHDKKHEGGEKYDGNLGNNDSSTPEEKPTPLSERPLTAGNSESSRLIKGKAKKHDKKHEAREKDDGNLGNNNSNTPEEKPTPLSERPLTAGCSDAISSTTPAVSAPEKEPDEMDQSKGNKSSVTEDDLENRNAEDDDKENVLNIKEVESGNRNILVKSASVKSKVKTIQKTRNVEKKPVKENCPAVNTMQGVKYKKLKTTNPKPFRLRTDERGILKEAILEKKVNSHENSTAAGENSQPRSTENDASATGEKPGKKIEDRILKKVTFSTENDASATREKSTKKTEDMIQKRVTFMPIKSKYKTTAKENADPGNENITKKTKSTLLEQAVLPQRETGARLKRLKPRGLGVAEKPSTAISKTKGSRQQHKEVVIPKIKLQYPRKQIFTLHINQRAAQETYYSTILKFFPS